MTDARSLLKASRPFTNQSAGESEFCSNCSLPWFQHKETRGSPVWLPWKALSQAQSCTLGTSPARQHRLCPEAVCVELCVHVFIRHIICSLSTPTEKVPLWEPQPLHITYATAYHSSPKSLLGQSHRLPCTLDGDFKTSK